MPTMSGLELQQALIAQGSRIPLVFLTAFPEKTVEARAMQAGAIGFLTKPFDEQELIKCIDKAIRTAGQGRSEE
jgi:FixJ family two-component response regulator